MIVLPKCFVSKKLQSLLLIALCGFMLQSDIFSQSCFAAEKSAENIEAAKARLHESVKYLASDKLEGRGIGSKGLDIAADYLATEMKKIGLKTDLVDGKPFQYFEITNKITIGPKEKNHLMFTGSVGDAKKARVPYQIKLSLGTEFNSMASGGSAKFDLPLVFVGYGISAKTEKYDDYANIDVKGKAVIILRHNPGKNNPKGPFSSPHGSSRHAYFSAKISNAYQHGAALVILCNDKTEIDRASGGLRKRWQAAVNAFQKANSQFAKIKNPTPKQTTTYVAKIDKLAANVKRYGQMLSRSVDSILSFTRTGSDNGGRNMPVVYCNRAVLDKILKQSLKSDLTTLEKKINADFKPQSVELKGWKAVGQTDVVRLKSKVKNVISVLPGKGKLAGETIVIGAHYDHLGRGASGSRSPKSKDIHNGADDNASGSASLIEVARDLTERLKNKKSHRRIMFIAFTAEERGLLGSAHYVSHPISSLKKVVAMLNMDMVGRLKDNALIIQGVDTANQFGTIIDQLNKTYQFKLTKKPGGFGPSDHSSFYGKEIPVMHFFTGLHKDYHKPEDDTEKVNFAGMYRISNMVSDTALQLAEAKEKPKYIAVKRPQTNKGGSRPYFGSIPNFKTAEGGYAISGTGKGSPADKGGLKAGDVIIGLGKNKIGNLEDFDSALRKFKAGNKVEVTVKRKGKVVKLQVILEPPR